LEDKADGQEGGGLGQKFVVRKERLGVKWGGGGTRGPVYGK